jgi:hypothetical protein
LSPQEIADFTNEGPGLPCGAPTPIPGVPCCDSSAITPAIPPSAATPGAVTATTGPITKGAGFWSTEGGYVKALFGMNGQMSLSCFWSQSAATVNAYYGLNSLEFALIVIVAIVIFLAIVSKIAKDA